MLSGERQAARGGAGAALVSRASQQHPLQFFVMTLGLFYIIAVCLLVLANGLFVTSEFALVGVWRSRIETIVTEPGA